MSWPRRIVTLVAFCQAGNLARVGAPRERGVGTHVVKTLKTGRRDEHERPCDKGHERCSREGESAARGRRTRRRRIPRGDRALRGLTPHAVLRTPVRSKALKAGARCWSHLRKWVAGSVSKRQEGMDRRRGDSAAQEGKTLKGESRTWQRGEINSQGRWRSKPSRGCETPGTEQSGSGIPRAWTPSADVAKGTETPRKAAWVREGLGGYGPQNSEGEVSLTRG